MTVTPIHCHVKTFSRSGGKSIVVRASYRAGVALHDEKYGKTHDYTHKGGVVSSFLVMPKKAPPWMNDRSLLWNMVEWTEKHCRATLGRECEIALPSSLSAARRESIVRRICQFLVDRYGVAVDASIHLPGEGDERNHHAHIMFTAREATRDGFGKKTRVLDARDTGKLEVKAIRKEVADIINAELAAAGLKERVTHLSHKDRGLDMPPTIHEGVSARAAARRGRKLLSFPKLKRSGRVVNYPKIDQGGSRASYNAEVVELQKYRKEETHAEKLARLTVQLVEVTGSLEQLRGMLNIALLSDSARARIKLAIAQIVMAIVFKNQRETAYIKEVREARETAKKIEELTAYQARLQELQRETQRFYTEQLAQYAAARVLQAQIDRMPNMLNGVPPYVIRLEIPLSSRFDEATFQGELRKQSTAELLKAVLSPPPLPSKPAMAPVTLRQEVLQIKELLARTLPAADAGTDTGARRLTPAPVRR